MDDDRRETASEIERIRGVYAERDRRGTRSRGMAEAYRRLNDERFERMRSLVDRLFPDRPRPGERSPAEWLGSGERPSGEWPRILDVGCGVGGDLERWRDSGWPTGRLAGTDVVPERLAKAAERVPEATIRPSDGARLPFDDASFDVATAVTVFSSILEAGLRRRLFVEMERVVRPGGAILVYDFVVRKPTNPDVVAMPMPRLVELAGRRPAGSRRLSPLAQAIAVASLLGPLGRPAADLAERLAPPTHRLSYWRVGRRMDDRPAVAAASAR